MDVNTVVIGGRLTADASQKDIGATRLTTFDIANNTGFGDKKKTNYFTVNLWGKTGDNMLQYLTKGQAVIITGELNVNTWRTNDEQPRMKNQIECKQVVLNGSSSNNAQPPQNGDEVTF